MKKNKRYLELSIDNILVQIDLFLGHIIFRFQLDEDTLLKLVYNDTAYDKVFFYNYDEMIKEIYVDSYLFLQHINEDHVPHGFQKNDDTEIFYAHTNSGAKIENDNSLYKLIDEYGSIKYFKKSDDLYYLVKKDEVEISRDENNNIVSLVTKDKIVNINYLNDVNKIIDLYGIEFNDDKLISSITYQDIRYLFNYYGGELHKIKEILEYKDNDLICRYNFMYDKTKVKVSINDCIKQLEFDYLGNLILEKKLECDNLYV